MSDSVRLLLISGSLRGASSNSALLKTAQAVAQAPVTAVLYEGMGSLPHFNPDDDVPGEPLPAGVPELRAALGEADAILFSTPEYAGALPGSFKNVLDWSVGGGETYRKPVAWVSTAQDAAPDRGASAQESLRKVLGYTGSDIVEAACVRIGVGHDAVGADGLIADATVRHAIGEVMTTLADHVRAAVD
jgi:NAD(P)H-dependent FMN reductase